MFLFKRIDRYVLFEVLQPWIGLCGFFFFTFLLFQTLRLADFLIVHHAPPVIVLEIAALLLVGFSPLVFPIAFLGAVMVGFGRLSTESELVAMKASGMSIWRLTRPVLLLAVLVSSLSLAISLEIAPWADRTMTRKLYKAGNFQVASHIQPKTFNSDFFGLMLYADEVDQNTGTMKNVFLYDEREESNPLVVVAPVGQLSEVRSPHALARRTLLDLRKGSLHRKQREGEPFDNISFDSYKLYLEAEAADGPEPNNTRILPVHTLLERIRGSARTSGGYRDAVTELCKRLAVATTPLIFCFLGAGLGSIRGRTVASRAYIVTLVIALGYWQTLIMAVASSNGGRIDPWIGMSLPNLAIAGIAVWAFRRASW